MAALIAAILLLLSQVGAVAAAQPRQHIIVFGLARDGTPSPATPTPAVEPTVIAATGVERWRGLVSQYDWPVDQALRIMACESGGDPGAVSYAGAVGLFQIHPYNPSNFDPETNVAAAYAKYRDGVRNGWPWMHWEKWGSCRGE